jgi:L-fuconolactonase
MTRIDSHQHFWRPSRGDYGWLRAGEPALAPLLRDFLPEHLEPMLHASGVARTVLVQAADSTAETDYLLELASRHAFIGGVVGWVDLGRRDAVQILERWARNPKFKGVRPMLQDMPDVGWIAHGPHPDAVRCMVELGLRLDALVNPAHLPALLSFVRQWPDLQVVIDHGAKPAMQAGSQAGWELGWHRAMSGFAALSQVSCKFSGLLTEMPQADRASFLDIVATLRPVWRALLEWFGPTRMMWGSDWPVLTLVGDYGKWLAVSEFLIEELPPEDQAHVWHGTAQRFYGIQ